MSNLFPESRTDQYFVYSYYCNNNAKLRISGIAQMLQESAWLHAESCDLGYNSLKRNGSLWVLSGLKIDIHELPVWEESLELKTWGRGYDSLFAFRDFQIREKQSKKVKIEATSSWLIIDEKTRRPKRITEESQKIPLYSDPLKLEKPGKIVLPESLNSSRKLKVLYSDIDIYNHVNNTRYIQWCIDSLGDYMKDKIIISQFEIRFISETHLDDIVEIKHQQTDKAIYFSAFNSTTGKEIFRALAN